ncbi:MAG TPA: hypothetical protein VGK13_05475 [Methanocellaceae archaeon]|jgi:hypothetical protein
MSDKPLQKIREKFEWYRMTLPKRDKEAFDRILEKSEGKERSIAALPGDQTAAVMMNWLMDAEERIRKIEGNK